MSNFRSITIAIAIVAFAFNAPAQEKKIKRSDLPAEVERAVGSLSEGATFRGFSTEKEKGQVHYEAELLVNGHNKDVLMDSKGAVLEVEEQVAIDSLPPTVKSGLQAKAGKGKLLEVESITKHDKLVAYEAQVKTGERTREVQVDPEGKPLDHEE